MRSGLQTNTFSFGDEIYNFDMNHLKLMTHNLCRTLIFYIQNFSGDLINLIRVLLKRNNRPTAK